LWSCDMTVECWDELDIYRDITRRVLDEFWRFVDTCLSWYFYVRGRYFVKAHGHLYAIQTLHWLSKKIKSDELSIEWDHLRCGSVLYDLPQSVRWQTICFPHKNCYYRGRKLSRWFIDHKIPFFVRDRVPLAWHRKNDQIFEVERIWWQQTLQYCFDLLF
jgi:hypothetical protein